MVVPSTLEEFTHQHAHQWRGHVATAHWPGPRPVECRVVIGHSSRRYNVANKLITIIFRGPDRAIDFNKFTNLLVCLVADVVNISVSMTQFHCIFVSCC